MSDRFHQELKRRVDRWNAMFPSDCPAISREDWARLDEVEERFWRARADNDWGGFLDWLDWFDRVLRDVVTRAMPLATWPPPVAGPSSEGGLPAHQAE